MAEIGHAAVHNPALKLADELERLGAPPSVVDQHRNFQDIGPHSVVNTLSTYGYLPGILQTEPYMRAIFQTYEVSAEEIERGVTARLGRCALLLDSKAELNLMTSEAALHGAPGIAPNVMQQQLEHMVDMLSKNRQIHLRFLSPGIKYLGGLQLYYPRGIGGESYAYLDAQFTPDDSIPLPTLGIESSGVPALEEVWSTLSGLAELPEDTLQTIQDAQI